MRFLDTNEGVPWVDNGMAQWVLDRRGRRSSLCLHGSRSPATLHHGRLPPPPPRGGPFPFPPPPGRGGPPPPPRAPPPPPPRVGPVPMPCTPMAGRTLPAPGCRRRPIAEWVHTLYLVAAEGVTAFLTVSDSL